MPHVQTEMKTSILFHVPLCVQSLEFISHGQQNLTQWQWCTRFASAQQVAVFLWCYAAEIGPAKSMVWRNRQVMKDRDIKHERLLSLFKWLCFINTSWGAVHKRRPQSRGLSSADKRGGVSEADVRIFGAKTSKFVVCPHEQVGIEPVKIREEGGQFLRFCADVFYWRPLTMFH